LQLVLTKLDLPLRESVLEVTLDMAKNMEADVKESFPNAILVTDRFHVVKLALESLQHIRVKLRWKEMDLENLRLANIRKAKKDFDRRLTIYRDEPKKIKRLENKLQKIKSVNQVITLTNGDTPKQLLARSRYILEKKEEQWNSTQKERASILFRKYPILETAYHEVLAFRNIYEEKDKNRVRLKLENWIKKVHDTQINFFYTVANTVENNFENILNYFNKRNTNAESFNSKIKLFRANQRGVRDTKFFLFRLSKLFA